MKDLQLLTKRDLCYMMGISIGKLDGLIKDNKIKYIKLGKSVRFKEADVTSYIDGHYKEEDNIISDWLEINRDPKIEIKVLNEVIDKLLKQVKELREELAYEKRNKTSTV